ncbi:MAG: type IX secretion system outer membrane channel protein PorV [Cyclobacteriaceae bacterium]
MKIRLIQTLLVLAFGTPIGVLAQSSNNQKITGQDDNRNPITVAVPFVSFAPDSRGSAMGDAGVASSPDVYSSHWNSAKLAFIENDLGVSFSYSPWLGKIVNDMSLNYLTFYKKIDRIQTFGASFRYFDLGEIQLTDENGERLNIENPNELAVDATYSRKLTDNMSMGVSTRFIWSNIAGNISGAPDAKAGTSVAVDIGWYYTKPIVFSGTDSELSFGANISNFGQKVNYSNESNEDFIPGNLRIGTAFKTNIDPYNSITLMIDANKLLVPTPPVYELDEDGNPIPDPATGGYVIEDGEDPNRTLLSGTFGSFTDAPNGFSEELQELMFSFGAEYLYQEKFAVRVGYFTEHRNKGNRKYFTAGVGLTYQVFGFDFSYLVPQQKDHPLAETLRLSFQFNMDQTES